MPRHPRKAAPSEPVSPPVISVSPAASEQKPQDLAPANPAKKEHYYRIRRINCYLSEILEVEVDESVSHPKIIGKQDLPELLMGRAEALIAGRGKKK